MRTLFISVLCGASVAAASEFSVGSPLTDERKVISGRLGASPGDVSARGLFVSGWRGDQAYSQGGGEVLLQGGLHFFQSSLGAILGAEADFSLGGASNETYADGTLRDQRREGLSSTERAKSVVWMTSRFGLRASLSLPILQLRNAVAFRLGGLGGVMLEANGSRSYELSPVFTAGAQLSLVLGPVAGLVTYLAIPTQGDKQKSVSHKLTFEVGFGPVLLGASWQLNAVLLEPKSNDPARMLLSTTFAIHAGYRFPVPSFR